MSRSVITNLMKKLSLWILSLTIGSMAYAQTSEESSLRDEKVRSEETIRLSTLYPEPRVGQSFSISLDLAFLEAYMQEALPPGMAITGNSAFNTYSREISVKDTGSFQIGPWEMQFNGIIYQTDSLHIRVLDPLPLEEGLWIRIMEHEGKQYLILEQQLKSNWEIEEEDNGTLTSSGYTDELKFAEPLGEPAPGIGFSLRVSTGGFISLEEGSAFGDALSYSRKIYELSNRKRKAIQLRADWFEYLPEGSVVPDLSIKSSR